MFRQKSTEQLVPRFLPNDLWRPPLLEEDLRAYQALNMPKHTSPRSAKMGVPSGFAYGGLESHVLLAACKSHEVAQEYHPLSTSSGAKYGSHGLFTLHLLHRLRQARKLETGGLTYASLMRGLSGHQIPPEELAGDTLGPLDKQTPHCEGINQHRYLFTMIPDTSQNVFRLVYQNGSLHVEAGAIVGLEVGGELSCTVSQSNGSDTPVTLIVTKSSLAMADLDFKEPSLHSDQSLESLHGMNATVIAWSSNPTPFKVDGLDILRLEDINSPFKFEKPQDRSKADISLTLTQDGEKMKVTRCDPLISHFGCQTISASARQAGLLLDHIARFNFHLYRSYQSREVADELQGVTVHLYRLHSVVNRIIGKELAPVDPKVNLLDESSGKMHNVRARPLDMSYDSHLQAGSDTIMEAIIQDRNSYYGLELFNPLHHDLFVYVFYFDPNDYSISASIMTL